MILGCPRKRADLASQHAEFFCGVKFKMTVARSATFQEIRPRPARANHYATIRSQEDSSDDDLPN